MKIMLTLIITVINKIIANKSITSVIRPNDTHLVMFTFDSMAMQGFSMSCLSYTTIFVWQSIHNLRCILYPSSMKPDD